MATYPETTGMQTPPMSCCHTYRSCAATHTRTRSWYPPVHACTSLCIPSISSCVSVKDDTCTAQPEPGDYLSGFEPKQPIYTSPARLPHGHNHRTFVLPSFLRARGPPPPFGNHLKGGGGAPERHTVSSQRAPARNVPPSSHPAPQISCYCPSERKRDVSFACSSGGSIPAHPHSNASAGVPVVDLRNRTRPRPTPVSSQVLLTSAHEPPPPAEPIPSC